MSWLERAVTGGTIAVLLFTNNSFLQGAQEEISLEEVMFQEIKVSVGTRGKKRNSFDSPVPVDIITKDDISKSGLKRTADVIQSLLPSFNYPAPSITDGTDHVKPATLRGLNPDQVLVLVNGKRRHVNALLHVNSSIGRGSTSVDLNMIPVVIIERIEILRDGSAAQYGSDAIAGIINIVLKERETPALSTYYGQTSENDGETSITNLNVGKIFPNRGFVQIVGQYSESQKTNRAGLDSRQQYFDGDQRNNDPTKNNQRTFIYGDPYARDILLFLNSQSPVKDFNFYVSGGLGSRHGDSTGWFRRAKDNRNVRAIYPDGFLPHIAPDIFDYSFTGGVKKEVSGWECDLSSTFGHNAFEFNINNSLNVSYGVNSPKNFYAGTLVYSQNVTNLDLFREIGIGETSLRMGWGIEYRTEQYEIQAGEEASYKNGGVPILDGPNAGNPTPIGSQVFPGFSPSNATAASRNNVALYIDTEKEVHRDLLLGLAGRFEKYSDFGSTQNGKLSLRYTPFTKVIFRGSTSTGFRAPSLQQQFFTSTTTNLVGGQLVEVGHFPVDAPLSKDLGATALKPEKSFHSTAGVVLIPSDNISVSLDLFYVEIKDRIVITGNFSNDTSIFGTAIVNVLNNYHVSGARFFTNAIDTRTQGADLTARYSWKLDRNSKVDLIGGLNLNRTRLVGSVKGPASLAGFKNILFDRQQQGILEKGQPQNNLNLQVAYSREKFDVALKTIRYGEVSYTDVDPVNDQSFGAKWLTYLNIGINLSRHFQFGLGGNNIFNIMPDKYSDINSSDGILPYNEFVPFGVNGAFYYVNAKYNF